MSYVFSAKRSYFPWIVCAVAGLFYCYEYLLRVLPSIMTPDLMQYFGINAAVLGTVVASYYNIYTPMQLPVGILMDRFGPRRLLAVTCLICAVGAFLFVETTSVSMALVGRLLVGFGSAFAFVGVMKVARTWLPPERFAMMAGLTTSLGVLGALFSDVPLNILDRTVGWRTTSYFCAMIGVILAVLLFLFVRDKTAVVRATMPTTSTVTFRRVLRDLIRVLREPSIWLVGVIGCLLYLPTTVFGEMWGVLYFQYARHFSKIEAGYAVSTLFLAFGLAAPFIGFIASKINPLKLMITGAMGGAVFAALLLYSPSNLPHILIYLLLVLLGICYSVEILLFPYACQLFPLRTTGTTLAVVNMLIMSGGMIFQPVVGWLLDFRWQGIFVNGARYYSDFEFKFALALLPIGLLWAAFLTLFLRQPTKEALVTTGKLVVE